MAAAVLACGAWPAWRAASWRRSRAALAPRQPRADSVLARLSLPVAGEIGIRLAPHRGSGQTALPVWATVTAAAGAAGLAQLGVAPLVVAPPAAFAILAAGLALAVAVTAVPALRASRSLPAAILRAE